MSNTIQQLSRTLYSSKNMEYANRAQTLLNSYQSCPIKTLLLIYEQKAGSPYTANNEHRLGHVHAPVDMRQKAGLLSITSEIISRAFQNTDKDTMSFVSWTIFDQWITAPIFFFLKVHELTCSHHIFYLWLYLQVVCQNPAQVLFHPEKKYRRISFCHKGNKCTLMGRQLSMSLRLFSSKKTKIPWSRFFRSEQTHFPKGLLSLQERNRKSRYPLN